MLLNETRVRSMLLTSLSICAAVAAGCAAYQPVRTLEPFGDERRMLSNIGQLTSRDMGFHNAGEAYFSSDQNMIIFQATPIGEPEYQIYTLDLHSGKVNMVSTGHGACTCAYFHPSGKKILFASTHLGPNYGLTEKKNDADGYKWSFHEHMDIFEADVDGSNLRRLTSAPGYDAEGSYSADGRQIVFTSARDGDLEIYVMDADGSRPRRITHGKGYDGGPFFSPDADEILYRGDRRDDEEMNLQLRIVNADGTNDRAITDNPIFNWCPYWYPSSTCFVFTQADHRGRPNYDLYLITPDGNNLTRVTYDTSFDGLPVFSPDGKKLMWTSQRGGLEEPQIFIADFTLPKVFR